MMKKTLILLIFSFVTILSFSQSKEDLQRKQQDLLKEISNLNKTLGEIRKNKKQSIGQLELVKRKIHAREELINNINKDIHSLDNNIHTSTVEINKLKRELDTLKGQYAKSLLFAYKNRSNYDYLNFIFSAASFNDAIKRVTYLKSYRQYRETQVANITKTQHLIESKIAALNNSKNEKSNALQDQGKQLKVLETDRKEQNEVVTELKGKETELASEIRNREKQRQRMKEAIAAVIRREQKEAMERARVARLKEVERLRKEKEAQIAAANAAKAANAANANNDSKATSKAPDVAKAAPAPKPSNRVYSPFESTEEGKRESISFENGRGSLPWPVDAGYVSIHFGPYSVPNSKIKGVSDGITISLPVGASVKSVAEGEVISVFDLGGESAVTIRHGKYFTTYSHLSSTSVGRGQQVRAGTGVGRALANDSGEGEVLFMVTNEKGQFLNPEGWLRRR